VNAPGPGVPRDLGDLQIGRFDQPAGMLETHTIQFLVNGPADLGPAPSIQTAGDAWGQRVNCH